MYNEFFNEQETPAFGPRFARFTVGSHRRSFKLLGLLHTTDIAARAVGLYIYDCIYPAYYNEMGTTILCFNAEGGRFDFRDVPCTNVVQLGLIISPKGELAFVSQHYCILTT